jgi:LmbE family N-acetylglucosaminyl deacetylase
LKGQSRELAWKTREEEARRAAAILGLSSLHFLRLPDWGVQEHLREAASLLTPFLEQNPPQTIYLPHPDDAHPDHQACWPALQRALRNLPRRPLEIRAYEIWSPLPRVDDAVDITPVMPKKMRALRAHRSQLTEFNYEQALRGLNLYRGALHGKCRYAEVFMDLSDGSPA